MSRRAFLGLLGAAPAAIAVAQPQPLFGTPVKTVGGIAVVRGVFRLPDQSRILAASRELCDEIYAPVQPGDNHRRMRLPLAPIGPAAASRQALFDGVWEHCQLLHGRIATALREMGFDPPYYMVDGWRCRHQLSCYSESNPGLHLEKIGSDVCRTTPEMAVFGDGQTHLSVAVGYDGTAKISWVAPTDALCHTPASIGAAILGASEPLYERISLVVDVFPYIAASARWG